MPTLVSSSKKGTAQQQLLPRKVYKSFPAKSIPATEFSTWYASKKQPENLTEFFFRNGVQPQFFQLEANQPTYILGAKGTELFINADTFVDMAGNPVRGKIQLQLQEVFRKSEIVLTNRPTTSQDKLLETGGALNIQAFQNYIPLDLQQPIQVEIPINERVKNPLAMDVFRGRMSQRQPFDSATSFDWMPSQKSEVKVQRANNRSVFALTLRELNWINCDYFFRSKEARTMITVQYNNVEPLREQSAFLVFHDLNSVARMYSKRDNRFTMFNIPVNHRASLIVVGMGQYGGLYVGKMTIERTSNDIIDIELHAAPEEEVVRRIQSAII